MYSILLTIHILVTVFLIGIILIQRSASDGMGLSSSSSNSFLSGRAAASAVTRATAILATLFILTSIGLDFITVHSHSDGESILDKLSSQPAAASPLSPTNNPLQALPSAPATPAKPSVPRPE